MFEWTTNLIEKGGYVGILFGMFLENIFPPIPSELIMIFSGASSSKGDLNIFLVILSASIGSVLGLLPWYFAGKWYGRDRLREFAQKHGRFLTFSGKDVDKAHRWFENHGKKMVFFGRFVPAVRTFIALPAAIMKMNPKMFLLFAFLGSLVWDGVFGTLGYFVGENTSLLKRYVDLGSYIMLGLIVNWYIYRVVTFKNGPRNKRG